MQDSDNKGFALYDEVASVVTGELAAGGTISSTNVALAARFAGVFGNQTVTVALKAVGNG